MCILIIIAAIWALSISHASAEPVLIKLYLRTAEDYAQAKSAGVTVYHRFEDFVLAEIEKSKTAELDQVGLRYQIVDENPWTAGYFLVTSREEMAKVDLGSYGRIILRETSWTLLKTTPTKAAELRAFRYSVIPIRHQPLPLEYRTPSLPTPRVYPYSTDIDSLLNLISPDSLYTWDLRLQNFQTRYAYSDSLIKARDWLYDKFVSFGIDSVWLQYYIVDSAAWNVVATVPGTTQPDRVMVVGGHYDSIVQGSGTNPYVWAPGADDNGSGTVAALEMARIIAQHLLPLTVMFVPFDQEEQGLIGSYYFASYLHNLGTNVELMINSDMIGHSVDPDPDVMVYGDPNIMGYVNTMVNMANTYTGLRPVYGGQEISSDNYSFYQWGYNALCALEGDFNYSGWHTNYDIVDSLNYPYMTEVVKMCLATLVYVSHSPSQVGSLDVRNGGDGHTINVEWNPNPPVENVTHYHVYFGTKSGEYDSIHSVTVPADTLRGLTEGTTYYVTVTAVNADDYESVGREEMSTTAYHFTLDQGILLVDETSDQSIPYNFVNDDSINAFYTRALQGYTYTYSDHSCPNCSPPNQLRVSDLLQYSPVIVHSEDNRGVYSLGNSTDSTYLTLKEYLRNGGKLIIEGRRNLSTGNDGDAEIRQFLPGQIPYDYLKVKSAYVSPWSPANRTEEFIGAFSQIPGYPDLQVDSSRVEQCSEGISPPLAGKLPGVGYIDSLRAGMIIYRFNSTYDTSASLGKPVAFRYLGSDYKVIFFDFPLYFIQEVQACSLLHRALSDLEFYPSSVAEEEGSVPLSFSLKQNFPNPFNSETVIEYSLPRESQLKITVYNLLGQKVKDLIDGESPRGRQKVSWDGKNDRGEVVASGIYFYRLNAGEFSQIKKMVFLK